MSKGVKVLKGIPGMPVRGIDEGVAGRRLALFALCAVALAMLAGCAGSGGMSKARYNELLAMRAQGIMGEATKLTAEESTTFVARVLARVAGRVPVVVVRGLDLPPGSGRATDLVRDAAEDLFL